MPKRDRLKVLTRAAGVREENPLLAVDGYFPPSSVRTPALREEADKLMPAKTEKQRKAAAVARFAPGKLFKRNRGLLQMGMKELEKMIQRPKPRG